MQVALIISLCVVLVLFGYLLYKADRALNDFYKEDK